MESRVRTIPLDLDPHQREAITTEGTLKGTLATDGEASDGDILDIAGGTAKPGIPLLFGHDTVGWDTLRNLGSWLSFEKTQHTLDGSAKIELDGDGAGAEFRRDVAHMIANRHIRALSLRWEATKEPIRRVNLPSDHPAFVDDGTEKDPRKRWGLYYPAWNALEGSVVSLGADKVAMIARANDTTPSSEIWRGVLRDHWMVPPPPAPQLLGHEVKPVEDLMREYGRDVSDVAVDLLDRLEAGEELADEQQQAILRAIFGEDTPSLADAAPSGEPAQRPQVPVEVGAPTREEIRELFAEFVTSCSEEFRTGARALIRELVGN